jgi:hypothetical protein
MNWWKVKKGLREFEELWREERMKNGLWGRIVDAVDHGYLYHLLNSSTLNLSRRGRQIGPLRQLRSHLIGYLVQCVAPSLFAVAATCEMPLVRHACPWQHLWGTLRYNEHTIHTWRQPARRQVTLARSLLPEGQLAAADTDNADDGAELGWVACLRLPREDLRLAPVR